MCLSTAYKNSVIPTQVIMRNVMRIECTDGCVVLTDLMEKSVSIEGRLAEANLVDGFVVIKTD